jgi:hypothetical protein
LQKAALEGLFSIGRAQVSDYILNEKNPLGSLRLARLRSILDEGKSLQLQFPAEDLGFRLVSPEQIIVHNISFLFLFSPLCSVTGTIMCRLNSWHNAMFPIAQFLMMIYHVLLAMKKEP